MDCGFQSREAGANGRFELLWLPASSADGTGHPAKSQPNGTPTELSLLSTTLPWLISGLGRPKRWWFSTRRSWRYFHRDGCYLCEFREQLLDLAVLARTRMAFDLHWLSLSHFDLGSINHRYRETHVLTSHQG